MYNAITIINTNTSTYDLHSILRILYHNEKLDYKETIDLKLHIITWECTYKKLKKITYKFARILMVQKNSKINYPWYRKKSFIR